MNKYSSYRSEMVRTDGRTDGRTDRRTDTEGYNIIPRHTLVAGYKNRSFGVKSGMFGQTAEFGQRSCLFHTSIIGIKNKLTKQTVKILMRRLIRSRLIWISTVCKCVSEFTWCPNLPYLNNASCILWYRVISSLAWVNNCTLFWPYWSFCCKVFLGSF